MFKVEIWTNGRWEKMCRSGGVVWETEIRTHAELIASEARTKRSPTRVIEEPSEAELKGAK